MSDPTPQPPLPQAGAGESENLLPSPAAGRGAGGEGILEDEQNPWRTLSTRPIYANPWIKVREDQVIRPDGNPGIYGVVEFQSWAIAVVPLTVYRLRRPTRVRST